jgi:hypothetical protein
VEKVMKFIQDARKNYIEKNKNNFKEDSDNTE